MLEEYIAPDQQRGVLEKCMFRLEEEKKLISDLMELGRLHVIGPPSDSAPLRLDEILRQVVNELESQAAQKNQQLAVEIDEPIPQINGSPKLLKSLWENLLSNAIKYTLPDGRVTARLRLENGQIVGEVQDTGIGIPVEEQGRLFCEFFRAKNAKELNLRGTGLGLVIVKRIVEGEGGTIWVESEEGRGTKFTFTLPLAAVAEASSANPEPIKTTP
jgi:signal transduction histidine kinase